ncbi:hypothetical protein PAXRUDRAFT_32464 [Paxillus rubicundulus Ve08.2h10]|uniref:Replication protein A C-terminal domain-containing protein n=1 Tax=Paxillus rubicundulus Ve08.2h10 TaxID=930991 RepID=A0A0D0DZX2_9AGAM|nr:hypothetical protein PAXRUDRAFT_32464 [Paxillus rubicundulus Ve08.2h10]
MTGGSPYGSTSGSPGGVARKSEIAHSLRPMTIYQLIQASQAHTDADWILDDHEIGQVTIVAYIASVQTQATNSQFMLDDGSGRIEARHWIDSSVDDESEKNGIVEGAYVRVLGSLKTFGSKKYINTNLMRPVSSPAEIYFHLLEAMTVTLIWERGPVKLTSKNNAAGSNTAYLTQPTVVSSDQFSHLPNLHRLIISFMRSQPPHDEGVHVGAIARAVGGDAVTISDAVDKLMDDGLVYATVDDSHFKLID